MKNQEKEITFLKSQNLRAREEIDRLLNDDYYEEDDWIDVRYDDYQKDYLKEQEKNAIDEKSEFTKLQDVVHQDLESQVYFSET